MAQYHAGVGQYSPGGSQKGSKWGYPPSDACLAILDIGHNGNIGPKWSRMVQSGQICHLGVKITVLHPFWTHSGVHNWVECTLSGLKGSEWPFQGPQNGPPKGVLNTPHIWGLWPIPLLRVGQVAKRSQKRVSKRGPK